MQITFLAYVVSVYHTLRKDKTRTSFSSTCIQCGIYLQSGGVLLSIMQMKIQSCESSSEVVTQKVQPF